MKELSVRIPGNEYKIQIGSRIAEQYLPQAVQRFASELIVIVTNKTIHELYPSYLEAILEPIGVSIETCILPDGEQYKSLETLNHIFDFLIEKRANRQTLLIAFGGGVIGDMTGFAAAIFMRGISYLQIPTTLLAQVDSSVGGKTAVNHALGKNTIGAFKQPVYVCMELDFLRTLPRREMYAGFLELVKHGIIHDVALFSFLEEHTNLLDTFDLSAIEQAIYASCRVKSQVVEKDEKEKGLRATLNFGHTLGHLLETHTHYKTYLHGEAVGVGMVFATYVSQKLKLLPDDKADRIVNFLKPFIVSKELPSINEVIFKDLILHDKKSEKEYINFVAIQDIGQSFIQTEMRPEQLWEWFGEFVVEYSWACQVSFG